MQQAGEAIALPSWWPTRLKVDTVKDRVISDKEHQGFVAWFSVHAGERSPICMSSCSIPAHGGETCGLRSEQVCLPESNTVTYEKRKANNVSSIPLTGRARPLASSTSIATGCCSVSASPTGCSGPASCAAKEAMGITDPRLTVHSTRHTTASKLISANVADLARWPLRLV